MSRGKVHSDTVRLGDWQVRLLMSFPQVYDALEQANTELSTARTCSDALYLCSHMLNNIRGLTEQSVDNLWIECWQLFDSGCLAPAEKEAHQQAALQQGMQEQQGSGTRFAEALDLVEQARVILGAGVELTTKSSDKQQQLAAAQASSKASLQHRPLHSSIHLMRGHIGELPKEEVLITASPSSHTQASHLPAHLSTDSKAFSKVRDAQFVMEQYQKAAHAAAQQLPSQQRAAADALLPTDVLVEKALTGLRAGGKALELQVSRSLAAESAAAQPAVPSSPSAWELHWMRVKQMLLSSKPSAQQGAQSAPSKAPVTSHKHRHSAAYYDQLAALEIPDAMIIPNVAGKSVLDVGPFWDSAKQGWCCFLQRLGLAADCSTQATSSKPGPRAITLHHGSRPVSVSRKLLGRHEEMLPVASQLPAASSQQQQVPAVVRAIQAALNTVAAQQQQASHSDLLDGSALHRYYEQLAHAEAKMAAPATSKQHSSAAESLPKVHKRPNWDTYEFDFVPYYYDSTPEEDANGPAATTTTTTAAPCSKAASTSTMPETTASADSRAHYGMDDDPEAYDDIYSWGWQDWDDYYSGLYEYQPWMYADWEYDDYNYWGDAWFDDLYLSDDYWYADDAWDEFDGYWYDPYEYWYYADEYEDYWYWGWDNADDWSYTPGDGEVPGIAVDAHAASHTSSEAVAPDWSAGMGEGEGEGSWAYVEAEQAQQDQQQQKEAWATLAQAAAASDASQPFALAAVDKAMSTFIGVMHHATNLATFEASAGHLQPSDIETAQNAALQQYAFRWLELAGRWHRDVPGSISSFLHGQSKLMHRIEQVYRAIASEGASGLYASLLRK